MSINTIYHAADNAEFMQHIFNIVGIKGLITDPNALKPFLEEPRGLFNGVARCLVRPETVSQTSEILQLCHHFKIGVVPQGGNTGLVGGQTPDNSGEQIILSLIRMNKVRDLDLDTDTLTVEAGITLSQVHEIAASVNRYFPLSYASEGSATIGGALATNSGGIHVIGYGSAGDLSLGVEAVLPDGRILSELSKLRKDNTGYKLSRLLVGSEGTLGVITASTLKLFPRPQAFTTAILALESPNAALELLKLAKSAFGPTLHAYELIPRIGIDLILQSNLNAHFPLSSHAPWYVILERCLFNNEIQDEAFINFLSGSADAGFVIDAILASSLNQRQAIWKFRELLPEAQKIAGASIKHDISLPMKSIPNFISDAASVVERVIPGARVVPFGHLGDGNIHYNISQPPDIDRSQFLARADALTEEINNIVVSFGGSISAEHGIGQLKRNLLIRVKDPVSLEVMHSIKSFLDPHSIMNPKKLI